MEDIILDETQSVLIIGKNEKTDKYEIKLVLSKKENDELDDEGLFLSAIAFKFAKDKNFMNECIEWFLENTKEIKESQIVYH